MVVIQYNPRGAPAEVEPCAAPRPMTDWYTVGRKRGYTSEVPFPLMVSDPLDQARLIELSKERNRENDKLAVLLKSARHAGSALEADKLDKMKKGLEVQRKRVKDLLDQIDHITGGQEEG